MIAIDSAILTSSPPSQAAVIYMDCRYVNRHRLPLAMSIAQSIHPDLFSQESLS